MNVFPLSIAKGVFTLTVLVVLISGCRHNMPARTQHRDLPDEQTLESAIPESDGPFLLPSDSLSEVYSGLSRRSSVLRLYRSENYKPVWGSPRGLTVGGDSLMNLVQRSRYFGLLPQNYHAPELLLLRNGTLTQQALRRDVLLTDAFLTLAHDLRTGRSQIRDTSVDSIHRQLLIEAVSENDPGSRLRSQEPAVPAYHFLKRALKHLLDTCPPVDRRLLSEGVTLDSIALHRKVKAIEVNLERWRGERTPMGDRYIIINIPAYMARVMDHDSVILESRVIVGTPQRPTPVLSSIIDCFITYPYWHVPHRIAVEELLPDIKKDAGYLQRNNFDVLDGKGVLQNPDSIRWEKYNRNNFPFLLRQREGTDNSLGVLKFVFDNRYGVYLHDTNARRLFQRENRAFSHGCIRMEKAVDFAHYLVTGHPAEVSPLLQRYLKQRTRHTIDVPNPIPVYVRYFTAEVTEAGLKVYPDIYRKDASLMRRLYGI